MKLQIKDDTGKTHTVPLTRDEITIGRKEGNTIRLTERNVSRTHARFVKRGDEIHVEDLSRYGTRVNGDRISETRRVGSGDLITIGDYVISLEGVKAVEDAGGHDAKLAAAGAAAAAAAPAAAAAGKGGKADPKGKPDAKGAGEKDAKKDDKDKKEPTIPPGYAMKTMPDGSISAEDVRRSLGAGKKRIGASTPTLVAVTTHLAGQEFPITGTTMILGRTGENDLKVDHQSISSNHAKVVVADGRVKMVDLKSKNGIRVNGEYWEESTLKSGDIVELGKVQFRFVEKGEEFIYRPEDYAGGKGGTSAAAAATRPSGGGKGKLVVIGLLVVGALVAVYFLVIAKPGGGGGVQAAADAGSTASTADAGSGQVVPPATTTTGTPDATSTAAADTAAPAPDTAKAPEPDTQAAVADTAAVPDNAAAVKDALDKAKAAMGAEKWDDAKKQLAMVTALDADNADAKTLSAKIDAESQAAAAFGEAQADQAKGDLAGAWTVLGKLSALPADSVYNARVQEMKNAVGPALANALVDQAKAAYAKKQWNEAIARGEDALKIVFNHAEAQDIIAKARKAKAKDDAAKPPDTATTKATADTTKPPDSGDKTGQELYKEARELNNSNPSGALTLFQQAAAKGYATAWKNIGSIKVKLGDVPGAISAYKRYITLMPAASDAQTIRDVIVQLGGTP